MTYPSKQEQQTDLYTVVIRVEHSPHVSSAQKRKFYRRLCRAMKAKDLIASYSRNWCVFTPMCLGEIRLHRHAIASWLLEQEDVLRFMTSQPVLARSLLSCSEDWTDHCEWLEGPRDISAKDAPGLLKTLCQYGLTRTIKALSYLPDDSYTQAEPGAQSSLSMGGAA